MRTIKGVWNHNIHYHDLILRSVPSPCERALDVGCGQGLLARRLLDRCGEVVAIDRDGACVVEARGAEGIGERIKFLEGDVMSAALPAGSFDLVTAVATLHHLPLRPALERFRDLLRPGGVLVVIGLYQAATGGDFLAGCAGLPMSKGLSFWHGVETMRAPTHRPRETLGEIRAACDDVLPGATLRRRLLFRYSMVWRKP